ncbi:galactose metabolism- protein [Microbotryomycetes sp. JL221]|nr:galactose metabolism- protein [Microbotryomycetes sp. JL221]
MGNSQSSNGQGSARHSRASSLASPRMRNIGLPDEGSMHKPTLSPKPSGRRKKSIELSDVDPALNFSKADAANKLSGARRKLADRVGGEIIVDEDDVDVEPGTLRGAMQGKAEHVVYGPRRDDGALPILNNPATLAPTKTATRPTTIALPSPQIIMPSPIDPDDTTHPGFQNSPRLTSEVIMSQDRMPVLSSPIRDETQTSTNPFEQSIAAGSRVVRPFVDTPTSLSQAASAIFTPDDAALLPPTTSPPYPSSPHPPTETITAPAIPSETLPISAADIPSGTSVIGSPIASPPGTTPTGIPSPAVLLPPRLINAPVAAIPIPLKSVPSATIAANLIAAAVDLGAGEEGVPTLIKWKDEDGQRKASGDKPARGPKEVFVTGTFAKGWKVKVELRKSDPSDFSALISLPPGPHRLKFIVDGDWKASKHLPVATDADGNLINYLQVNPASTTLAAGLWNAAQASSGTATPSHHQQGHTPSGTPSAPSSVPASAPLMFPGFEDEEPSLQSSIDVDDEEEWTQEIPPELVEWGEWEAERDAIEASAPPDGPVPQLPPPPASSGVPPPSLPAQLEKGPLNHAAYVTQGSGDDNSILPKPDHSVINHLAASPIKGGFLSVGVTTRYKRKFVTVVYYKALPSARG